MLPGNLASQTLITFFQYLNFFCCVLKLHCIRASEQVISTVLTWRLQQADHGTKPVILLDAVARDTSVNMGDLKTVMPDSSIW